MTIIYWIGGINLLIVDYIYIAGEAKRYAFKNESNVTPKVGIAPFPKFLSARNTIISNI